MGSLEEAEWAHYQSDPSDRHPEPPWSDADLLAVELDRLEAEGYYDDVIQPTWLERVVRGELDLTLCMEDVDGRPCIYPASHDGDHMPLPTMEEIHGADPS